MQTGFIKRVVLGAAAMVALLLAGTAQAALQDRDLDGNGVTDAFYDTDLDITWLRDANVSGLINWPTAVAWADGYSFGGHNDWRLPSSDNCEGYNCTGSEMGHLWYVELGNSAGTMTNMGDFQNLLATFYWSGTVHPSSPTNISYLFMPDGWQGAIGTSNQLPAMAVRDGDVPAIPEPTTYALMLAGLAALALAKRHQPN